MKLNTIRIVHNTYLWQTGGDPIRDLRLSDSVALSVSALSVKPKVHNKTVKKMNVVFT